MRVSIAVHASKTVSADREIQLTWPKSSRNIHDHSIILNYAQSTVPFLFPKIPMSSHFFVMSLLMIVFLFNCVAEINLFDGYTFSQKISVVFRSGVWTK